MEREPPAAVHFGVVLDALPLAVVLLDGERRVVGWNQAAEVLYGYAGADVRDIDAVDILFDGDDREEAVALLAAGAPWEGDFRVRRRDGALLVSSFRLEPVAGVGQAWIATDGMDQGLAEQERAVLLSAEHAARATAEEALSLLEAILESAPVAIAVFDLHLRYVRVNDAYAELSGYPAQSHVGGALGDAVAPQVSVIADLRRVLATNRMVVGRHVELRTAGGDVRHFTVSYFPVRSGAGSLVGAGLAAVEITRLKQTEEERAALLQEAEAARRRLSIVAAASTVLTTSMDVDELLGRLARALVPTAADWCVVGLFGRTARLRQVAVAHRNPEAAAEMESFIRSAVADRTSPIAEAGRTGLPRLVQAPNLHALWGDSRRSGATTQTCIVAPLETRDGLHGILVLAGDGGRHLDDDDVDVAVEVAHRAALAVGNARAYQQEHQIAETLQRALLPAMVPSLRNLDLAVSYVAATDGASVGGDWYDVLPFDDGSATVVIGDVVGHDIAASTAMGQLRSALRAYAYDGLAGPSATLTRLERVFEPLGLTYATCVVGAFDPAASTFRWSNAGHPPPVLVRDGRAVLCEGGAGLMLGVGTGMARDEAELALRPGDLLVLYTDGLVERRGEPLADGLARLCDAAAALDPSTPAAALCDQLVASMVAASDARHDDVALLVAAVGEEPRASDVIRLDFEPRPDAAAMVRGYTTGVLRARGLDDAVDSAVLLVSELVTNTVRHANGPCALVVTVRPGVVELAVEDGDPRVPTARSADPLDEAGRGLVLVEALADDWGVRRLPGGKATWFSLRTEG